MKLIRNKMLLLAISMIGVAGMLGGSLGVVVAGQRELTLTPGVNYVGGPLFDDVTPEDFVGCLPDGSWDALYVWKGETQEWQHYFNTSEGLPAFLNDPDAGGIPILERLSGAVLVMDETVANPFLPDAPNQADCS